MDTGMVMKNRRPGLAPISGLLLFLLGTSVFAQENTSGTAAIATGKSATTAGAADQSKTREGASGSTWSIKPRISLTETYTDNANINRTAGNKQSDFITEIAPGIHIDAHSARLKAYLDYTLRQQLYAREAGNNRSQNSLNAFGTFEAVDNWLFLDFSGLIAQQAISAFGTQSTSNTAVNSNSTETANYRLSPYIRGQLGGLADYSLRYTASATRSDNNAVSDIDLSQWAGQIRGNTAFQKLRWTIDGSQQSADYSKGRKTDAETLRTILTYSVFPQFRVALSGGRESNNYASLDQESHTMSGYGFDWTPTQRTNFSVFREKRFFGNGHDIKFGHRFPMSSIQFSDTRDVSVLPNQFATVGLGSIYDLYFNQFASLIPDPIARATFVNTLLSQNGITPNTQVVSGFTTSQATIRRTQQLSFALFGARNSITLQVNRGENQAALASASGLDSTSQSSVIQQQGFSVNLSHRLSNLSNVNLLGSRQESTGSGANSLKATTTLYQVNVSTKLGAKTTGSLSARRSEFDSTTNPYTENALIGTVSFIY